ncbi:hypothetical protein OH786_29960 [Streptomyces atratus]|uniref:Chitinase n=1 Tax=Streptomyces atratus TaxID=1893 RepID=A0A1K1Z6W3_STRAR|nr:hypothetical protein [Streptomyces atratus]SFX69420.1 hypothetical protein SAMN02787144_1005183 [Streptomyces atratus]
MHPAAPPRRLVAALAGISCLLLPLLGHLPKAYAAADADEAAIDSIRAAGGDIVVSVGGWSGDKLGEKCTSAAAPAGAYQKVINAYHLKALDIDIEDTEFSKATVRQRVVDALKIVKNANPGLVTYVTTGTTPTGPDATGKDLIERGAVTKIVVQYKG